MATATKPETVAVNYDYYDRLLDLKLCVEAWAKDRERLTANPEDKTMLHRVADMERVVIQALHEVERRD